MAGDAHAGVHVEARAASERARSDAAARVTEMNDNDRAIAERLADRLVRGLAASRVVWFGSRAAGEGRPGSDWDLLVVADSSDSPALRAYRAEQVTADVEVPKDFVVVTPAEHRRLSAWRSSVVHAAEQCGIVLYASE